MKIYAPNVNTHVIKGTPNVISKVGIVGNFIF